MRRGERTSDFGDDVELISITFLSSIASLDVLEGLMSVQCSS